MSINTQREWAERVAAFLKHKLLTRVRRAKVPVKIVKPPELLNGQP
jgi:hypothetical protein